MSGKTFVISLANATARRSEFGQFAPTDGSWAFFDAYDHIYPDLIYDRARLRARFGRELRPGEIGCYSSHYALWRALLEDETSSFYVLLEDDVRVDWTFIRLLLKNESINSLRYVRLYYKRPVQFREITRGFVTPGKSLIEIYGFAFGTQGYVITKDGARELVDKLRLVDCPIDDALDKVWRHKVRSLAIFPFPIYETEGQSTIGDRHKMGRDIAKADGRELSFFLLDKMSYIKGKILFMVRRLSSALYD